jgi:hypothetical protein
MPMLLSKLTVKEKAAIAATQVQHGRTGQGCRLLASHELLVM